MNELFDSEKVRGAARAVYAIMGELADGAAGPRRRAVQESEPLQGKAADAMRERLTELNSTIERLCAEMDSIGKCLDRYAEALEDTSEELVSEMQ
ncbi:MAG: hypothetical protein IKS52_09225 [Clostridia bacterium]|nr:hypothetical protein [Clostridia bacterium]